MEVKLLRDDEVLDGAITAPDPVQRWKTSFANLRAGNYVITAREAVGADDAFQEAGIGVR